MSMANSIFSLTLDQFQTKSGKNLGSINIQEILNLLNEVNSDCSNLNPHQNAPVQQPNLSRQPSFSIPTPLSGKTIEEILVDINKDHAGNSPLNLNISPFDPAFCQENLDSMTLEEFLVKLGIFKTTDPICFPRENVFENLQDPSFNMGYQYHHSQFTSDPTTCVLNGNLGGQSSSMLSMQGGGIIGQSCNNNYGNESGRKNSARNKRGETNDPLMVGVTDSKQRRMLKNRESAARSRARKQAYTLGIEAELTNLKQENEDLKFRLKHLNEHMSMEHKKLNKAKALTRTNSL